MGGDPDQCNFAIVPVTIEQVDSQQVTFTTRASAGTTSDLNLRKTFTVPLTEVYLLPIAGAPAGVPLKPGATGNLYLSRTGWRTTTPDGFQIFGLPTAVFKWPDCASMPHPTLTRLPVIASSIRVRGHLAGESAMFDLELHSDDAARAQNIAWNGVDFIELRLTEQGARRLGAAAHAASVRVWPTEIVITGSPTIDLAVSGSVNILDDEIARGEQSIAYTERRAPINLALTQDGIAAFHVTPQLVAELLAEDGRGFAVVAAG